MAKNKPETLPKVFYKKDGSTNKGISKSLKKFTFTEYEHQQFLVLGVLMKTSAVQDGP